MIGGIADYWSKLELGYHVATTQNHRDAIEIVELALTETKRLHGRSLLELVTDKTTGEVKPVALVTDNCASSRRPTGSSSTRSGRTTHSPADAPSTSTSRRPATIRSSS